MSKINIEYYKEWINDNAERIYYKNLFIAEIQKVL